LRVAAGAVEHVDVRGAGRRSARIQRLRCGVEHVHDARSLSRVRASLAVDDVFAVRRLGAARRLV